ncbi:hypothetical protein, partial [Pseudomonas syringae]|uniref:hypothetical protein n=1 Tax=Pseudomonas syringae TaxID=317 RepID=UPI001E3907E7
PTKTLLRPILTENIIGSFAKYQPKKSHSETRSKKVGNPLQNFNDKASTHEKLLKQLSPNTCFNFRKQA